MYEHGYTNKDQPNLGRFLRCTCMAGTVFMNARDHGMALALRLYMDEHRDRTLLVQGKGLFQ